MAYYGTLGNPSTQLFWNGTDTVSGAYAPDIDPMFNFPSYRTVENTTLYSDFVNITNGLAPFISTVAVGGTIATGTAIMGRLGIVRCGTGAGASGSSSITALPASLVFGSGTFRFRADVLLDVASTAADAYTVWFGFNDVAAPGNGVDGAYFRYTDTVMAGQWQCVNRSNSVETVVSSSTNATGSAYQCLEIEVVGTSSVRYAINGVVVATNTSSIPTLVARATGIHAGILKSVGTTARGFDIDWMGVRYDRGTRI